MSTAPKGVPLPVAGEEQLFCTVCTSSPPFITPCHCKPFFESTVLVLLAPCKNILAAFSHCGGVAMQTSKQIVETGKHSSNMEWTLDVGE